MAYRLMRASFTDHDVTVCQAFTPQIADAAVAAGTFVAPFKRDRMTGQGRILAIQISRDGFEWALAHAVLSHYEPGTYHNYEQWAERLSISPVRIQWDPDRSLTLAPLSYRAIQVGLSGEAVSRYRDQWITTITDLTNMVHELHGLVTHGNLPAASARLPAERIYPLTANLGTIIGADQPGQELGPG